MFTKAFWKGAVERMIRAAAATLSGVLLADGFNVADVEGWKGALVAAGVAAGTSLLMSLVAGTLPAGPEGSPSLVHDRAEDER